MSADTEVKYTPQPVEEQKGRIMKLAAKIVCRTLGTA